MTQEITKHNTTPPWEQIPHVWKTEAQYWTWVRGEIRRAWANNPLRIEFLSQSCRPVTQEEKKRKVFHPLTKTVGECVFCHKWFPKSKLQVDHIDMAGSCNVEAVSNFLWRNIYVDFTELQLACVPCHQVKSYADQYEMSFYDATVAKAWIKFNNEHSAKKQKEILLARLFKPEDVTNEEKRKACYIKLKEMEDIYETE